MLISLIVLLILIPRLFRDLTKIICDHADPPLPTVVDLISRARKLRLGLKNWYYSYIGPDDTPIIGSSFGLGDGYYKLLVLFYLCSIYSNRLNTCMHWIGTPDIDEMEEESQRFANAIVFFCKGETNLQSSMILAQKLPIAEATIETGEEWKQQWRCHSSRQGQLFKMPKQSFRHWCSLFGRKAS